MAEKKFNADFFFEKPDLAAQGRLSNAQTIRGLGERPQIRDFQECLQPL